MSELLDLNLVEATKALKNKDISSLELTKAYLKSIFDTSLSNTNMQPFPPVAAPTGK